MGVRTRFYRPRGLAVDYVTRSIYVADSYNHRIRVMLMTDVPDEVVVDVEEWYELVLRALRQNFIFILILVSTSLCFCCSSWVCCRFCSLCPLYQRRRHERIMRTMEIGSRA